MTLNNTTTLKLKFICSTLIYTLLFNPNLNISVVVHAFTPRVGSLLPEIPPSKVEQVSKLVSNILDGTLSEEQRKIQVQDLAAKYQVDSSSSSLSSSATAATTTAAAATAVKTYEQNQFVYGELSIPTLATIFDAVGIHEKERFLDIGSGDGALVFATALLYEENIDMSRGIEIVPDLKDRSEEFKIHFSQSSNAFIDNTNGDGGHGYHDKIEFHCGDVYNCDHDEKLQSMISDTTIAVCFATTWSRNYKGRKLPELSSALGKYLEKGARVVMIDGKLDEEKDHFHWGGDLVIQCPDTAPYSIASLYEKV